HGSRALKESDAVLPVAGLTPGDDHKGYDNSDSRNGQALLAHRSSARPSACSPNYRHEQPNERHIGIPVRARLKPNLHQSDHRNKRPEVPEPSDGEILGLL